MKLSVRPATPADALAIAQIQAASMIEAISAALEGSPSAATKAMFEVGALTSTWQASINNVPQNVHVLVADANREVQGLAVMVPAEPIILDGDAPTGLDAETGEPRIAFEITNFDVPARFAAQQHEPRMLAALTDLAKQAGATEIHQWVIAGYDKQTQFLSNAGFAPRPIRRVTTIDGNEVAEHVWWALLDDE